MERQIDFFDTNVLVAAAVPTHMHHLRCFALLLKLRQSGGSCSAHTLAETYNTLTRSTGYGIAPFAAMTIVEQASEDFALITLSPKECVRAMAAAVKQNLIGPRIFDALLIACARKARATAIYTNDIRHFRLIAPDLASIIHEP